MFTISQIKEAHAKVKSGADFPQYIQDIIALGVKKYHTYVHDGHSEYFDEAMNSIQSEPKYAEIEVAEKANEAMFKERLQAHQEGQTDYMTFCTDAAGAGVQHWTIDMNQMTCTYYGSDGQHILTEEIPTP